MIDNAAPSVGTARRNRVTGWLYLPIVCLGLLFLSDVQADNLEITDDYLQGLSDEIESPDYVLQANQEISQTKKRENKRVALDPKTKKALTSVDAFETILRTEFPASYSIYTKLTTSTRLNVFTHFRETKKLSAAKRMILDMYALTKKTANQ
ncbi:hypothetical protein MNBD_GAMMA21-2386 [hydrothermal vent metagenome]|uniref:Uncharacterized protein n=1 Tax=hydrothermal vent metagenome TaxID=652676 RepID=A0A3B1AJ38_9ZZZZ